MCYFFYKKGGYTNMPLNYRVVPNALTVEPSYRADVLQDVLSLDDVSTQVAISLPQVGKGTIELVISSLRSVIINELSSGRSVNLEGFVRFFPSIPGRLDSPTSTTTVDNVQINSSISTAFEQETKIGMSLSKQPYVERVPVISSIVDASGANNFLGTILTIKGDGLNFSPVDETQGIFIKKTQDDTEVSMSIYASITNGQVVGLNDMITEPISTAGNEFQISARVRYTVNGNLRTGTYLVPSRYTRGITDTDGTPDDNSIFNSYVG
jgi:nucleoid DNA-binding protein